MGTHPAYRAAHGLSDWARHVLSLPLDAVLGTVNADGSPHMVPVGFAFHGERFIVPTGSTTRKVRNLEADPRARVLVMTLAGTTGVDDGWVAADGTAELVRGPQAQELNWLAAGRYLTEEGKESFGKIFMPTMDVAIVIECERWQTWDETGMLQTMQEHGYTVEDAARWYVPR